MPVFWTAHQILKQHYGRSLRVALLLALFAHFCMFVMAPPFDIKPYKLKEAEKPTEVVRLLDPPDLPKPPPEVRPPDFRVVIADNPEHETEPVPFNTFRDLPALPPPRPEPGRDQFFDFDQLPVALDLVVPEYPELARDAGIEGKVTLLLLVDEKGKVLRASVENSDVTPAMERAALEAARKSRFHPARQGARPVKAMVAVPFYFRLR